MSKCLNSKGYYLFTVCWFFKELHKSKAGYESKTTTKQDKDPWGRNKVANK